VPSRVHVKLTLRFEIGQNSVIIVAGNKKGFFMKRHIDKIIKTCKNYPDRTIFALIFIFSVLFRLQALAIICLLMSIIGWHRFQSFVLAILAKIEESPEGTIPGFSWKDPQATISSEDSMIQQRSSGIPAMDFSKYYEQGRFAMKHGNIPLARKMFEQAEEIDSDDVQVQISLGLIYNMLGENKKSIEHSKRALDLLPDNFVPQFNLAVATNHFLGSEKSLPEYLKAEKMAENSNLMETVTIGKLNLFLGHDYRETGDLKEARRRYDRAKRIFKLYNTPDANFWLKDTYKNIEILEELEESE